MALWPQGLAVFEQAVSGGVSLRERTGHATTAIALRTYAKCDRHHSSSRPYRANLIFVGVLIGLG
jgi:hypothetical protein